MRVHHVALQVTDLHVARAFYVDVLGFVVTREQGHSVWLDAGGATVMLELCAGPVVVDAWAADRAGLHVVAFAVAAGERAAWLRRLDAAGVAVDHVSGFSIYFRDPFGARLALSHFPDA